jgi:hypothetical protein
MKADLWRTQGAGNASTREHIMILETIDDPALSHTRRGDRHHSHIGTQDGTRWKARIAASPILGPHAATAVVRSSWFRNCCSVAAKIGDA